MAQNIHEFLLRLKALFQKRRMDRDMADELAFHQAMLQSKLVRQGASQADADAATRRAFGNASRWHERLRELWQFRSLENLGRDVSFSARVLRKSPGFTAVALLTLALGVGANTTVFSMINGLLLRPLPVPESDRLVVMGIDMGRPSINYSFSEPLFRGLEHRHEVFSEVFAFNHSTLQVRGSSENENVPGQLVSGEFFNALKTAPLLGRTLTPADDRKGGDPAGFGVVISESFWERWFNRAPTVIGQKLQIDNTAFTVVGVMPKGFIGADPLQRPDLFLPLATEPVINGLRSMTTVGVHASWLVVMGRLQPGATLQQANAQVGSVSSAVLHQVPSDAQYDGANGEEAFSFHCRERIGWIHLRPLDLSQAADSGICHVRRHPAAGMPEPGKLADGARSGAPERTGHPAGAGGDAPQAGAAAACGEPVDRAHGHSVGPGDCSSGQQVSGGDTVGRRV